MKAFTERAKASAERAKNKTPTEDSLSTAESSNKAILPQVTTTTRETENEGGNLDYLTFHLVFTVPLFVLLVALYLRERLRPDDASPWGVVIVAAIALVYTTPWDSYMIRREVWGYGDGRVFLRLFEVPLGEYLFFVLQPLVAGLWLYLLLARTETRPSGGWSPRYLLAAVGVGVTAVGWWWAQGTETFYIGMILVWAGPVLVLQWAYGGHYVFRNAGVVAAAVVPPTVYFASADRFAIENGIWIISDELTAGLMFLGLPVEEGAFFLVTNLLVVQGVMLFRWTLDEWRAWAEEYEAVARLTRLSVRGPSE
jgi:lycopene cyclase domain-containing protein